MTIQISKDAERTAIESIKRYFLENLNEEMGDLKSRLVLDFFMKEIGPLAYNQGVADAQTYMRDRVTDMDGVCHEQEFDYWRTKRKGA
jgi:uncharacterized protein (DUF2164 family)